MNDPRFEVFPEHVRDTDPTGPNVLTGEFVWHFKDANGRITFIGGESFTRREDAHRSIIDACGTINVVVFGNVGQSFHRLRSRVPIVDLDENGARL